MRFVVILAVLCLFGVIRYSLGLRSVVSMIKPKGFRIQVFDDTKDETLSYMIFNVNVNKRLEPDKPADFVALIMENNESSWTYDNVNVHVRDGMDISYDIAVYYDSDSSNLTVQTVKHLKKNEVISSVNEVETEIEVDCPANTKKNCELSKTTVRGKSVCKGKLIFEENFYNLNPKVWKIDARIPWDTEDSPFVSFQDDPRVVYTDFGWLHIKPKFLWETSGFNESLIKTGTLKIESCSGIGSECVKQAKFAQILPPIISARIRTRHSFSFRYGKVVIGAKMPKGDWAIPMLHLEPLENFYGPANYASGLMKIASLRGNEILRDSGKRDLSNRIVSGGIMVDNRGDFSDDHILDYNYKNVISNGFHNFTLTWTENEIILGIDDYEYGTIKGGQWKNSPYKNSNLWKDEHLMAPFDREFYLTIGLSAGGNTCFPNLSKNGVQRTIKPWENYDPKAMLHFWNDRENWLRSWREHETKLQISFVEVYAL